MALVNLKDILHGAQSRRYAIGAFNVVSLESLQAILEAATQMRSPVILNVAEVHFKYVDLETIAPVIRRAAERAPVPVALHLDHGVSFEAVMRALRSGFTSVMFDGSTLPYEENVEQTRLVVKMAHAIGVTVEAELGHIGGAEGSSEATEDRGLLTEPKQAEDFVRRTGVDALAVAIGSAHGLYKSKPKLDFERLVEIREATGIPLVLHGGSGIPDEDFKRAIELGICKINVYTEMAQIASHRIRGILDKDPSFISFPDLLLAAREAMRDLVAEKIRVFGTSDVCSTPNSFCPTCQGCVVGSDEYKQMAAQIAKAVVQQLKN
jgi:fructose-bisphosphate aldolase class II